ncbi:CCR4-NOT transcription complex subunit 3 [Trichinella zimbabwensis]|uniref:CCR4-NOT transcription complex subunit 3 n=1 Tax=Trichinella zimbabwensis TaxID=268475 RepID=A0A0V1HHV7_9BILA|nr:CCR4-NOT transcription complex subunit 3 [Trichinella zimbabwensis]
MRKKVRHNDYLSVWLFKSVRQSSNKLQRPTYDTSTKQNSPRFRQSQLASSGSYRTVYFFWSCVLIRKCEVHTVWLMNLVRSAISDTVKALRIAEKLITSIWICGVLVASVGSCQQWQINGNFKVFHILIFVYFHDLKFIVFLAEMERCLKRVQEGVELFDQIWEKVHEAANLNQKEKFEADLKKEIKKLQRMRDQIKGWQNSNDVKDKTQLCDSRRLIEQKMEQFKIVERETKTKAYSKQGLGAEQKIDPKEKEKEEIIGWLQDSIGTLNQQSDVFEGEMEQINAMFGKKRKPDRDKQDRLDDLLRHIERHKFHVTKLESMMRLLVNNTIDTQLVKQIKEDIEYYIENCQEPDFDENEFIYDDLNLGNVESILAQQLGSVPRADERGEENDLTHSESSSLAPSSRPSSTHSKAMCSSPTKEFEERKTRYPSESTETSKYVISNLENLSKSAPSTPVKLNRTEAPYVALNQIIPILSPAIPATSIPYNSVVTGTSSQQQKPVFTSLQTESFDTVTNSFNKLFVSSEVMATERWLETSSVSKPVMQPQLQAIDSDSLLATVDLTVNVEADSCNSASIVMNGPACTADLLTQISLSLRAANISPVAGVHSPSSFLNSTNNLSGLRAVPTSLVDSASWRCELNSSPAAQQAKNSFTSFHSLSGPSINSLATASTLTSNSEPLILDPILGAVPLGKKPLTMKQEHCLKMAREAMKQIPLPSDKEKARISLERVPYLTPPYYPQSPLPLSDTFEHFNRLSPETLFFVFYYLQGTKSQYLAAKALKRQSWRFHTKYMMWFQRLEEPKGTYIYFDFERWMQRKKEDFTFEYRYLEDKELP